MAKSDLVRVTFSVEIGPNMERAMNLLCRFLGHSWTHVSRVPHKCRRCGKWAGVEREN